MRPLCLLGLSGSLRQNSTNSALLMAAGLLAPSDIILTVWNGQAALPHFSPDLEDAPPAVVQEFRSLVEQADGLLIACPEYARGIPGSFKNALDWLVGSETFLNKKYALWNASPRASEAQRSLHTVLETMSGRNVAEAALAISLISQKLVPQDIFSNDDWAAAIRTALQRFAAALRQ